MKWFINFLKAIFSDKNPKKTIDVKKKANEAKKAQKIEEEIKNKFNIKDDVLYLNNKKVDIFRTPNVSMGRNICDFVVIHYTGTHGTFESSQAWAGNINSKVSWHLTIGRNGEINQCEHGLRSVLWHAGKSEWYANQVDRMYKNLNKYSIGIELANGGKLKETSDGKYVNQYGHVYDANEVFFDKDGTPWEKYTDKQIRTAKKVSLALAKEYNCVDIVGHEDIAPNRKIDPGPAFPLKGLQEELYKQDWYKHVG